MYLYRQTYQTLPKTKENNKTIETPIRSLTTSLVTGQSLQHSSLIRLFILGRQITHFNA
jgi:hypothetical protein